MKIGIASVIDTWVRQAEISSPRITGILKSEGFFSFFSSAFAAFGAAFLGGSFTKRMMTIVIVKSAAPPKKKDVRIPKY